MVTGGCEETSDEIFNFKCTPCSRKKRNREAVKYCVECQGYCCESCVDMHEAFPTLEGHQLLDKSDFKSNFLTSGLPEIPTVRCKVHGVKILDMYCGNHDVVGCTSCMAINHRTCTDVHLIQDIINTDFQKSKAEEISLKLQENIQKFEKIIKAKGSLLNELNQSKTEAVKAITDFRKEMESILKNLEKESLSDVEKEYGANKAELEQEKKTAEEELADLKQTDGDLQKSEANKAQQFVYIKTAQQKVESAEDKINALDTPSDTKIEFNEDVSIRDTLTQLKTLGSVNIRSTRSLKPKTDVYAVAGSRNVNIRFSDDTTTCYVTGSCLTESGMLLLTDRNNKKLKRVDVSTMALVDNCDLPYNPWHVCVPNKQEAAVSFGNNIIQFVSLGAKMAPTRQLTLDHPCLGIACKDNKLYMTDNSCSLYIHDMSGKLLQTVSKDSSGNALFTNSWQVACSEDNMFVVDQTSSNRLTILDIKGNYISTFTDTNILQPLGVCIDGRGNVFVCGCGSHNVVQVGEDGKKKDVLVNSSDGLSRPYSVCFVPKQQLLVVTLDNKDILKVFNLQ